ncbi:PAS domain-containing hybrid sensor histidine kinase/response regulator [Methylobacterium sp. SyP6R]|uniref:PAS domain-containing hybrid sensor histidine kinase/response regulator n=1 Tax=Methylobacterium sp. SyP6R TaxID=2718876 RepID=UPI001F1BD33E|nr:PAS domain-containing hybrid sensor histidine kinase/response regulator [Methylobacterium sp. SyP6R]MCF4126916.1 ATP-binding protein [Methylobacterium sp. SyP6R]
MVWLCAAIGFLAVLAWATARWSRLTRSRSEGEVERLHDLVWRTSESEQRYRSLVEAQIELVVQRDAEGRITFANQGFAALLDTTPEGLLGTTREAEVVERGEMRHRADGARLVDLAILPAGGGAVRWFAFVETVTAGRDGRPEVLRAGRDVTERVESARFLEEARSRAEAASVAKSRFIASVSHEFRTPLNGIMGMADLMLDTSLSPEQRTYAEAVKTSGEALLSLIDGILDFSKIEAGRLDLAAEPFDPAALVESVVELLAPRAQDKGLEIAADIETLPARLIGDADRVRQVLINLAGNAVKFTEAGGVGVTAAWDEAGFTVAVHDTGPGIPEERLPLLFQEFEQGDGSASRRHEGTGLGLAITRRLVDRMGGWLDVTSRPGEGSCFRVRLPLRQAPGHARPQPPSLAGQRVLVVAAAAFEAPYIARRLGRAGAEAVVVETADEAAAILSKEAFDAVIADRALGDSTVRGIAAAAREAGVGRSIVLLSPFDRRDFGSPAAAGFDRYLIKPVRLTSLLARLAEPTPPPTLVPRAHEGTLRPSSRRPRVLLAEDNPINALLATKALERLGAVVLWARDGAEAVARLQEAADGGPRFDVALVDIRMPILDGLEAARQVRAHEAMHRLPRLRLVALTANVQAEDQAAALAAGFDGFLSKPLDLKALPPLLDAQAA